MSTLFASAQPVITVPPLTQFAWDGTRASFTVTANGTTPLRYQWQFNGADMPGKTNRTFSLAQAHANDSGAYRVIVSDASGFTVSQAVRFTVRLLPSPTGPRVPELAQFDTNMLSLLRSYGVPGGSLAVVKDDRLVLARGYGYADIDNGTQVQPDSLFRLASLSKTITAAAVLKLVEEGKLSLEARAFPLLNLEQPVYRGATYDPRMTNITVQQLLWHSAGWERTVALNPLGYAGFEPHWWPTYIARDLALTGPPTPTDALRWVTTKSLQNPPGRTFNYSGAGFLTAGRVVEKVSGLSFGAYVSQMLAPAGISHIRVAGSMRAERAPGQVVSYLEPQFDKSHWPYPIAEPKPIDVDYPYAHSMILGDSTFGMMASAIEYARFASAIDGNPVFPDILNTNTVKTMSMRPTSPRDSADSYYGMGWDSVTPSTGEWRKGGAFQGGLTLVVRRGNGVTFVALLNMQPQPLVDNDALYSTLESAVARTITWPTNNLFPATLAYDAWRLSHFTANELADPSMSGDLADGDRDGLANLMEYALGLDPKTPNNGNRPRLTWITVNGQTNPALTFRRVLLAHEVTYAVEVSDDLITWSARTENAGEPTLNPDGTLTATVRDTGPLGSTNSRFLRLRVSRLP